jgi:hypothetical protein
VPTDIKTFESFWPYYVREHQNRINRRLHFTGTTLALICLTWAFTTMEPVFFLLTPIPGYGFAWLGHFFIEKNRPATFTHPLWSLAGDFKMYGLMISGAMDAEMERLRRQ